MGRSGSPLVELNRRIERCARCARLREHCRQIGREKRAAYRDWAYWGKPVPNLLPTRAAGTSDPSRARLLLVGLAPAAHGANRTGRMFTGDKSGDFLYRALYEAGLASQPTATGPGDGLALYETAITAALHCAPPANKPTREELDHCAEHLEATFDHLPELRVVVALGQIGHQAVLRLYKQRGFVRALADHPFAHGRWHHFEAADNADKHARPAAMLDTYHPSQQNTFTGRLTPAMLRDVFAQARERAGG